MFTSEILNKLSDEYEAKNNWDRYFSDKLSVKSKGQFSRKWSELYEYRNAVAHGKIICRADYDKAVELTDMFEKMFEECIDIIDTLQINNEQAEAVEAVAQQMILRHSENELEKNNIFNNDIGTNKYMSRISMNPHTITDAVNNLCGMSITYSADELETIAGQMNSIGKMTHGMIPELVMGGTFTRDSVANYLNTRIYVGE